MLPTAQLAIKTVNYDLVSSIAGATSLFLLISYLWTGAPRAGWAAFALCDPCSLGKADSGRDPDRGNRGAGAQAVT